MEVPECPPTPPLLTEGLSSPKSGPTSPASNLKEDASPPRSGSPEPNCPICLGPLNNKSYSDSCFHKFCFKCLLEWSKVKAECPLCKQKFKSIIHNVKSMEEYDQYTVQPPVAEQASERLLMVTMDPWAMSPWFVRRHGTVRRHAHLPQTVRRTGNALIQLFDMIPRPHTSRSAPRSLRDERQAIRDNQRLALREARSRLQISGMDLRRSVYRTNLWAQPLADVTGRYRECSLAFFKRNPAMTHRLLPWISRDLSVLCDRAHIAIALERVNGLLLRHDMRSQQFSQEIREFFGEHTRHFVHELVSFARSPYDMLGYDREVSHDAWYPGLDYHVLSFNEHDSSSEDDIMEVPYLPRTTSVPVRDVLQPSPEPGPSTLFERFPIPLVSSPQSPQSPLVIDSSSDDDPPPEVSLSDVEVVAVLKPKHERTPEIVDLLTDSDTEPNVNPADIAQPWEPEQASTSHMQSYVEPGPSTSSYGATLYVDSGNNTEVKTEDDRSISDVENYKQLLEDLKDIPTHILDISSDDINFSALSVPRKSKHKKSKKKSKRRFIVTSSSDDDDEPDRPRKHKSCVCKSCDKDERSSKSKKSKSRRHRSHSSSSSPKRSKTTKRSYSWSSSDESDVDVKRPRLPSKVVWQIRENNDDEDNEATYQQPRIRSIVVKRQPIIDSPASSSSYHRQRSASESSWEPSGSKHHKKCKSKDKGKGKGKGKGKKKSE